MTHSDFHLLGVGFSSKSNQGYLNLARGCSFGLSKKDFQVLEQTEMKKVLKINNNVDLQI